MILQQRRMVVASENPNGELPTVEYIRQDQSTLTPNARGSDSPDFALDCFEDRGITLV